MNESYFESIFAIFDKKPLFVYFGHFLGNFPIWPVLMIPWLLNWIIIWIESGEFFLNWILFWIEPWVKQYWMKYWMNYLLAKFKHWIESDWVSATTNRRPLKHPVFLKEPKRTVLVVGGLAKQKTQARPAFQKPPSSLANSSTSGHLMNISWSDC